jgi:hypothetical protein
MFNAHWIVSSGVFHLALVQIYNSVGFGIAYPRKMGNTRALVSGMSDEYQDPALFLYGLL